MRRLVAVDLLVQLVQLVQPVLLACHILRMLTLMLMLMTQSPRSHMEPLRMFLWMALGMLMLTPPLVLFLVHLIIALILSLPILPLTSHNVYLHMSLLILLRIVSLLPSLHSHSRRALLIAQLIHMLQHRHVLLALRWRRFRRLHPLQRLQRLYPVHLVQLL